MASGSGSSGSKAVAKGEKKKRKARKRKCKEAQDEYVRAQEKSLIKMEESSHKKKRGEGKGTVADIEEAAIATRQQALALSQQLLDLQLLDQADRRLDTMYGPRGGGGGGKGAGPGGGGKVAKGQGSMDQIICQAAKGSMKGGKETMDEIHNGCYLNYTPQVHKGQPCGPPPGTPMPNVDPMEIEPVFHNPMWKLVERRKHEANTPPQGTPDTRYDDYWDTMVNDTQDRNYGHFMTAFYKGKHKGRLIGHY